MAPLKYPLKTSTDIEIPFPIEKRQYCEICNITVKSKNALAGHIGAKHGIKLEDYLVKYYMGGQHPQCPVCEEPTRYLRGDYAFKKYCTKHANESRKEWAADKGFGKNGFDHNWRTGQTKETNSSIAQQAEKICGNGNPAFLTEQQFIEKLSFLDKNEISLNLQYTEYVSNMQAVEASCKQCDRKIIKKFSNLIDTPKCPSCWAGKSKEEQELYNFVLSLNPTAQRNVTDIISKELDIYVPEKKIALEYNGLYWHTEDRVGKKYHVDKTQLCTEKDIQVIHVFSDEWREKSDIVKSIISHKLGYTKQIIYAGDCEVKNTSTNKDLSTFFNNTHISGHTNFMQAFYLQKDGEILCALSLRKSFHKKYNGMIEIARFSSKLNTSVVGGFSRLLKYAKIWAIESGYSKILTYADLRFGTGNVYSKCGFKLIGKTRPDYWYTDAKKRYNRFDYKATNGKSEKQICEEAGVKGIYGCGSNIYEYSLL